MKKILWKSDLWQMTKAFGVITLCCLAYLTSHLVHGQYPEAFGIGVVTALPATLTLLCAFTDRGEAMVSWVHPHVEQDMLERAGILEESCLNPANSDRARRAMDEDRPPDIG